MNHCPEDWRHCWLQHEAVGGTCTCLCNKWRQREPHAGSTDSGRAEPAVLEDPPKRQQSPHRGHTGAGNGEGEHEKDAEMRPQKNECITSTDLSLK